MRKNSRNTKDQIETNNQYNHHYTQHQSNKENVSKNRPQANMMTKTGDSDLFNITPKRNEMHQLIQQLELPNESLTLSSLSQSPFQTNARRGEYGNGSKRMGNHQNNDRNNNNSDSNSDMMGRSDYQGGLLFHGGGSNNNTEGIRDNQTDKNLMYTTDEHQNEGDGEDYEDLEASPHFDDYSQYNIEGEGYSDYTDNTVERHRQGRRRRDHSKDNNKTAHIDTADEEEINDYYHSKSSCRDISPDFTGQSNNEDLTVSHTLISNNNVSQLGKLDNQVSKIGGAQNRTFADSVINHRLLTEPATQNKNYLGKQYHRRLGDQTNPAFSNNDAYRDQEEDDECINERDEESKAETSSDISGLNSFTQTQYSKHSKIRPSMQFRQIKAPSVDLTEDNMVTKRSPNVGSRYQNMDHDSSLQLTPDSMSSKYLLSTSKSGTTNNKQMATNRTIGSEQNNPLKKLATKPGQNKHFGTNLNLPLAGAKHNSSISRDHELESALVEDSKHLMRGDDNSVESLSDLAPAAGDLQDIQQKNDYKSLLMKVSHLSIENEKSKLLVYSLKNNISQREQQIFDSHSQNQSLQNEYENCLNHLELLKVKTKDDSKLQPLRGKQLAKAIKDSQQLKQMIQQKDFDIQRLDSQLVEKDVEYKAYEKVVNQELKRCATEIDKLKIINESLKKQKDQEQRQNIGQQDQFKQEKEDLKQKYQYQIKALEDKLGSFQKTIAEKDNQFNNVVDEIRQLENIIEQNQKMIENLNSDKQKLITESKKCKERCDELEKELNQFKQYDNSTLFGNSINLGHGVNNINQGTKNNYDYEMRKIKEVYEQNLNKAKADAKKRKDQCSELETKIARLEEESKKKLQESISQQSNKLEQDQDLLNEIKRMKVDYDKYVTLQNDIRLCFQLEEEDDIMGKLQSVRNVFEENQMLQEEYLKVQNMLQEAQVQIKNYQQQAKQAPQQNLSQFTQNLLLQKEKEISRLKQVDNENQELQGKYSRLEEDFSETQQQLQLIQGTLEKAYEAKQKAEQNVDNLKDQVRTLMRAKEDQSIQSKDKKSQQLYEDLKSKYQELINMILKLDMAPDSLLEANFSLQNSFMDEFEQASQHLNNQERLVNDLIKDLKINIQTLSNSKDEIEQKLKDQNNQIINLNKEYASFKESSTEKDKQLDIVKLENTTAINQLQKQQDALKSLEQANLKLKSENEGLNNDYNKIMRTQEHLYKNRPKKVSEEKINENVNENSRQSIEFERLKMLHEDQIGKLQQIIDQQNQKINNTHSNYQRLVNEQSDNKEFQRNEMLEILDKLIVSGSKMPNFNELAAQLSQRIEKIRNQERLKLSAQEGLKQYQNNDNQQQKNMIAENYQLGGSLDNNDEQEFVLSVAKWLKQSQGAPGDQQLKNFFKNEDNSSMLMLNDLINQQQQQQQNPNNLTYHMQNNAEVQELKQELLELKQEIEDKENMIGQLQQSLDHNNKQWEEKMLQLNNNTKEQILNFQQENQIINSKTEQLEKLVAQQQINVTQLNDQIQQKEAEISKLQQTLSIKQQQFEQAQQNDREHFKLEIEQLKETVSQDMEQRQRVFEEELENKKSEYSKDKKETEKKYQNKLEAQEKEFREKLQSMEKDVRNGCEKSKEEVLSNIHKEMEEQHNSKVKQLKEEHLSQMTQLKQDHQKQLDEAKRVKDRELKRMKEESERARKSFEEKIKKLQQDIINEREQAETENKSKNEEVLQRHKKEIKTQQDKVRAEMRNQIDSVKNDCIKQKAEWEREKKKMISDYQQQIDQIQREFEEKLEYDLKAQKELLEKQTKKKIEDKEKLIKTQNEEYEFELEQLSAAHQEEMKKVKERIENRIRDQVRSEIRDELDNEYREEFQKAQQEFQKDVDLIKQKCEQLLIEEKQQSHLLIPQQKSLKSVETQCNNIGNQSERAAPYQSMNQSLLSHMSHSESSIDRIKYNHEQDLERQQQVFELQLTQRQQTTVRIFEELIKLECKKILDSIFYKSGPNNNTKELDAKRREVNSLINSILNRSDDRQEKQMKTSLDNIKVKICEVLRQYKESLEAKLIKSQAIEQPVHKPLAKQLSINGAVELSHNISRTSMSNVEFKSEYGESDIQSLAPTPRGALNIPKNERSIQIKKEFEQYLNEQNSGNKNQYSDIKKYIEYNDENNAGNDNVLKKVTPVPNKNGVMMVEVEKVVRDIKMLQQTIKSAKFYRILMPSEEQSLKSGTEDSEESNKLAPVNNEYTAQAYRQLLNDLMKVIIKLNKGVDTLGKQQEVYKLKLLNTELKEQISKLQQDQQSQLKQVKAEEIMTYYSNRQNILTESGQECLQRLEYTQFQINKLQFSTFQLCDLFTTRNEAKGQEVINTNTFEVAQKCKEYISQYPEDLFNGQQDKQLGASQFSPEPKKISPEMLSPEETAQLIASVFQKLSAAQTNNNVFETTGISQNNNNQFDTHQSFFNTFLSNDDYKKSAENFIKQYRDCQKLNQTQRTSTRLNIPLQKSQDHFNNRYQQQAPPQATQQSFQHSDMPLQMNDKKRSSSQTIKSNNSCYLPPQYVSNVFQSNMLDKQSINSYQPGFFDSQSQNSFVKSNTYLNHPSIIPQQTAYYQQHQSMTQLPSQATINHNTSYRGQNSQADNVSNAQQNVNALFNQLKLNFNVPSMHQESFQQ